MKNISRSIVLAALCLSVVLATGFVSVANAAEDVLLNSSKVAATSDDLNLIRTSMTPSEVELTLPISMGTTVCAEYGTRVVSGQSGAHCGYDSVVRRVCVPERVCHVNRRTGRTECTDYGRRCYNEVVNVARYCSWEETYCVRRAVETTTKTRSVTIKFKKMGTLATGEQEVFSLKGQQNHTDGQDATFNVASVSTRRPVSIKTRDGLFTGGKDVVIIKGQ